MSNESRPTFKEVTPDLLRQIGEALYGTKAPEVWHARMREELEVSDRSFRRWLAGSEPVPRGVVAELSELMAERVVELEDLFACLQPPDEFWAKE